MATCVNIKECKDIIKKIKKAQRKYPKGFNGNKYNYWCLSCDTFNTENYCYCDNDE